MILAVADFAEGHGSPPPELRWGWRSDRWGLPSGRGWLAERALMLNRMSAALRIYDAVRAWRLSKNWAKFATDHPSDWDVVCDVLKLRESLAPRGQE